jgi:hypothetical protein
MASTSYNDFLSKYQLYAGPESRLLICCHAECGFALAVIRSQATTHLQDKYSVQAELRKSIMHYLKHRVLFQFRDPSTVYSRQDGSPTQLRLFEGYNCRRCGYRTISGPRMDRHIRAYFHGKRPSYTETRVLYDDVYFQTWVYCAHGASQTFWIVKKDRRTIRSVIEPAAYYHLQAIYEREHELLENQARKGPQVEGAAPQTFVVSRPWIDCTRWGKTYKGLDRSVLRNLTVMPAGDADYIVGYRCNDNESDVLSPRKMSGGLRNSLQSSAT